MRIADLFGAIQQEKREKPRFLRKYDVSTSWRYDIIDFLSSLNMRLYYIRLFGLIWRDLVGKNAKNQIFT